LKPAAAEVVKKRGEISLSGRAFPDPDNQCLQQPIPYVLGLQGIEWVVLGGHSGGSMQVRTLRRRYSSSRSP
jgi:hypothetical protein